MQIKSGSLLPYYYLINRDYLSIGKICTKLHLTTALCFPFRVYRPSCLNRQACDPNHAARPVCTRYEWDDRALRTSHPHVTIEKHNSNE